MAADLRVLLTELIETAEDELGIIEDVLKSSAIPNFRGTQEDLALEAVRSSMQATLHVMKAARANFK